MIANILGLSPQHISSPPPSFGESCDSIDLLTGQIALEKFNQGQYSPISDDLTESFPASPRDGRDSSSLPPSGGSSLPPSPYPASPFPSSPSPSSPAPSPLLRRSINMLFAEDLEIPRKILIKMIESVAAKHFPGSTFTVVVNGKEAVDLCRTTPFDIVFLDTDMPELDGLEATTKLRAFHQSEEIDPAIGAHYKNVPIISLSARLSLDDAAMTRTVGMNEEALNKPFHRATLLAILNRYFPSPG